MHVPTSKHRASDCFAFVTFDQVERFRKYSSQPADFKYGVSFAFRQLPEQRHSEDISFSMPFVHSKMSVLSFATDRANPSCASLV